MDCNSAMASREDQLPAEAEDCHLFCVVCCSAGHDRQWQPHALMQNDTRLWSLTCHQEQHHTAFQRRVTSSGPARTSTTQAAAPSMDSICCRICCAVPHIWSPSGLVSPTPALFSQAHYLGYLSCSDALQHVPVAWAQ